MTTMQDFVRTNGIAMRCAWAESNPHMDDSASMDHWRCVLTRRVDGKRTSLTVYFSQGYGHNGKEPQVCDVLDCLASDAAGIENARDFADWADEYGYAEDSRAAERTYRTCQRQAQRLGRFLGGDLYQTILFDTEPL